METPSYGKRNDGTEKGNGFFGPLKMEDGSDSVATEISVGIEVDGKETEIPTLVPTLSEEEKKYLLKGGDPLQNEEILRKAEQHALKRIADKRSPFADEHDAGGEVYVDPNAPKEEVFVDTPPAPKFEAQKLTTGINQALATVGTNQDVVQAFTEGYINAPDQTITSKTDQHVASSTKRITDLAGKVEPKAIAKTIKKRVDEANDGTLLGKYKAYIRSMPVSEKLSDAQIGEAASSAYLHDLMAEVHDKTPTSGKMIDFAQSMLQSTDNIKMKAVADYFGLPFSKTDAIYKTDFVRRFADSVRKMPAESKAHIYKKLVDNWETMGGFDNKHELITFLGRLETMDDFESTMMNVENAGDVLGAVGIVAGGVSKASKLLGRSASALKFSKQVKSFAETAAATNSNLYRVAQLQDADATADVIQAGARGELKVVGVDPLDAANAMTPFDTVKQLTPGAPKDVAHSILERQKLFDEIAESEMLSLPISEEARTTEIDKLMAKVSERDDVSSLKVVDSNGKDFTIEYQTVLGGTERQTQSFKLSDVGTWEDLTYRHGGVLASPKFKFPGIADELVDKIQYGNYQGNKLRKQFDAILEDSFKGADSKKVMGLVEYGSETKKVFSYSEAVDVGVNGVKYSPKDYGAYATVRQAFDAAKKLKEQEILAGWKIRNIKHFDFNGSKMTGKVYEAESDAAQAFSKSASKSDWFIKDGKLSGKALTTEELTKAYGDGYKLIKANPMQLHRSGGHAAEWVLAKANQIHNPVGPIINDIPGYVTRINENANFFLKKKETIKVGDKLVDHWVTLAYDDVYTDLEKFRKSKYGDAAEYKVFADRELSAGKLDDDVIETMGGLYTGGRASAPIPYGPGKAVGKQAPVLESLQRYINHVANHQPIALYREGLKQKWINSAIKNDMIPGYRGNESFSELSSRLNPKADNYFFFKRSHDEITAISGIRTTAEMEMQSRMTQIGKWFEPKPILGRPMASFFHNGRVQQVEQAISSATYHCMMGLYNVAHPFIQFSGSIVPLAANPVSGMKGLWGAMELTVLDYMSKFGSIKGMKSNKVNMGMWDLWKESGMGDAITHSNIDFARVSTGDAYDAGLFRKIATNSDVLALMGEQGYSRVSFATAYHHVASELGRTPTIADVEKITARADLYKMNMGKANAAGYQKDAIAKWPGMFMQAQTKFVEKMLGSDFTKLEKTRIIAGQMALFGASGIPFIGSIAPQILAACGVDVSSMSTETLAKIHKGVFGWLMSDYLGLHSDFSGRFTLGTDFVEKAIGMVFSETHPIDAIGGARWGMIKNTASALEKMFFVSKVLYNYDHISPSLALSAAEVLAEEALSVPASTRNMIKGYTMYNSQLYKDKSGLPVFYYRDPSLRASITQAMGFQNEEANDWYTIADGGRIFNQPAARENYAKMMAGLITKFVNADADKADAYGMAFNAMQSAALSQRGGEKVLEQCIKYLKNPKETWHSKLIKGMGTYQSEYSDGYEEWMKILNVRSNLHVGRELEKYGVKK